MAKLTNKVRRFNSLKLWSAITGVALAVALVLTFLPMQVSIDTDGLLSISLSPGQTQAQEEPGEPAYQVLIPTGIGSGTGLQVYPPKLQDGGTKTNWLAVQNPQGLDVPVGTMILDEGGGPVGVNASIGDIYIDPTTGYLIISPYTLSDKCSKQIDITNYTTHGNETVWSEQLGKNVTSPLRAKFRSYVYGSGSDTYQLENCPQRWDARNLTVVSVAIYAIVRGTDSGSTAATRINTATKKYNGNTVNLGISNDTRIETVYALNPNTGNPWTWDAVDGLEAGINLKSSECSYVYVQVETEVHSQTFFPITPVNVTPGTGSWTDVNCSSYIASGATGVILHWYGGDGWNMGLRKNGSTDARTQSTNSHWWCVMGVDANRVFEAYKQNAAGALYLVGYTMSGVTMFTNAYDKSLSSTSSWTDIACSSQSPSAIGLLFEIYCTTYNVNVGFRKNGSTDARTPYISTYMAFGVVIGCDASQICEAYISSTDIDFYLLGYITDGCTFNTNASDKSLGSTGSWVGLSALPSEAVMCFMEVDSAWTSSYTYGLRKKGSSEELYNYCHWIAWSIVECDTNRIIEGKISNTVVDFWLVGYATAPGIVAPTVTTQAATSVLSTSCTGNGNITATGGANATTRGFCYMVGTTGDPTTANSTAYDTGSYGTGTYTKSITGLTPSSYYRVRAYAINSAGTGYGTTVQVTTLPGDPSGLVDTAHNGTSVTLNWTKGTGADYTLIRYGTTGYPTGTTDGTLGYNGTASTTSVGSLSYGQIYYWRAWAWNSTTTLYSSGTSDRTCYTDPNAPTSFVVTQVTNSSIALSWTLGTGADWTKIQYRTDQYPATYTDGTQAYNSTGTSVNVTSLSAGQIYYFRAWSYDTESGYYDSYAQLTDYTLPADPPSLNASNPTVSTIDVSWTKGTGGDKTMVRYNGQITEEQTAYNTYASICGYSGDATRRGQRLTISGRVVAKLSFPLRRFGTITGDVTFTIRKVSDDSLINSAVWGDASALPTSVTWEEATFSTPVTVNEEVRIQVEFSGGDHDNYILVYYQASDVKANEKRTQYIASYTDYAIQDGAYKYTYTGYPDYDTGTQLYFDTGTSQQATSLDPSTTYYFRCWSYDSDSGYHSSGYSSDTETTLTPAPEITNTPDSWDFGILEVGATAQTTISYFTLNNTGNCAVDITIQGTNMIGGGYTWTISGTATPGNMIFGMKAGLDDADDLFDVIVRETATYNTLVSALAESATQGWGLKIYMPTSLSGYDSNQMSGNITLVASEAA